MLKYSAGIDISHKKFDVCLSGIDGEQKVKVIATRKFSNNQKGFTELHIWLQKHYKKKDIPLVVIMEATGVYYEGCALFLSKKEYTVCVVLPNKAKKYLQATGLKSKNDKIDARGLARMGAEQSLRTWKPMSEYFYQLRTLTRQYQSLQELKTNISNQLHADENGMFQNKLVTKQLNKLIKSIDKQLKDVETAIHEHITSNDEVATKTANICKIKGVGVLTVATVLAETNGFELFENSTQLVSYAGYDVVENQSGNRFGKTRISKKGNSRLRRAMHMPALSVVTWKQKPFVDLFERTLLKHNIKMKSYVAVQKKLLLMIYTLWKKNEPYDNEYQVKLQPISSLEEMNV